MAQKRSERERQQAAARREAERARREAERLRKAEEKAAQVAYQKRRVAEAETRTKAAEARMSELTGILTTALATPVRPLDFKSMKRRAVSEEVELGADARPLRRPLWADFAPRPPGAIGRLFGGDSRYASRRAIAERLFDEAMREYEEAETARQQRVREKRKAHAAKQEAKKRRVAAHNAKVDELAQGVHAADRHAVSGYYQRVVDAIKLPSGCPAERKVGYVPESTLLAVEWRLPGTDIIPRERSFKYVKSRDSIDSSARAAMDIRRAYQQLSAQIALVALRAIFESDPAELVDTVTFNGVVEDVDRATGQRVQRCLITLRATREHYQALVLDQLDAVTCVTKHFAATVSPHPEELVPVTPVMSFDMADPRIVDPVDIISEIDRRPNLVDLSAKEFEHFIQNLFTRMGFDTKVFRADGDGGVDCVAFDPSPITGGKFVIQAKRYTKTVQPAAVRDLYGTVQHEGATKGILITTAGFGPSSHEFANGKPLQLIDGTGLLALCHQHKIPARIVLPPRTRSRRPRGGTTKTPA
ncbi:restriction endonuclease [Saccharomonospora sp. NB11]|jgi:restriction system protein|uniref:restriction endonuclease n=1 Tax=Saccharomonospora sp. NB11 TaxID=1642298 RepID=UPI0018D0C7A6|nr:restriction endonuclease [Saccharomonospora sp. NB11]